MQAKKNSKTAIIITLTICATLVLFCAIGAAVYMNQQNLAQQRELKEQEIKTENEQRQKDREAEDYRASKASSAQRYSACKLSGSQFCI